MYLGIDLGTSAVKLLLMNEVGKVIKTISKGYPLNYPQNNWAEQNPEDWWNETISGIKEISNEYKEIKGISFSGQMHGLVILDENDEIIRPAILWCDQRTEKECKYLNELKGENRISDLTGNIALTGFTVPKILWVKENEPENFKKIKKIMLPKDYLVYLLTGVHATDTSDASGMLLLDVEKRTWNKQIMDLIGIEKDQLAKVLESTEVVGKIKENLALELGISKETKIIIGGGDNAVGAIGVGAVTEGTTFVTLGTSGVVFSPTNKFHVDKKFRLHSFCAANNKYHQMGVMLSAGAAYKWWVEKVNESRDYDLFNKKAFEIEAGSNNLYFLPYLMGERTPYADPNAKGSFVGLNMLHNKGHMTRAILEGVGYGLRDSMELLKNMGIKIDKVRVSGGGSKSKLWKQILADIFNADIVTVNSEDGPAFGAAIIAAVACDEYSSIEEACKIIIKETEVIKPDSKNVDVYEKGYNKFKTLYPAMKEIF